MLERVGAIPAWVWIVGAVLVIAIIFAGYRVVQTQHRLQTVRSELVSAKDEAAQTNARVAEFEKRADSLRSELDKANVQRNELQTKLDQATTEMEAVQSEVESANQAADRSKTEAAQLQKQVTNLNSELDKANAQRDELQTKLDQGRRSHQPNPNLRIGSLVWRLCKAKLRALSKRQISQRRGRRSSRNKSPVSIQSSRARTLSVVSFRPNWIRQVRRLRGSKVSWSKLTPSSMSFKPS
jgi:chromosome segregation ATPase